ncbi:transcription elongation regulator [Gryganskiella cystojenkinii]|nr:transcription elongation regulator [Gryganskiella cystojenkinii]
MVPLLPPGWTEHKAPDGMSYFYNASTGTSSWVRPTPTPMPVGGGPGIPPPPGFLPGQQQQLPPGVMIPPPIASDLTAASKDDPSGKSKKSKKVKKEKAVKKVQVMDSPWFIVTTSQDNTFYYNKETKTSIWIPTAELDVVLTKMGQIETEKLKAEAEKIAKEERDRLAAANLKRAHDETLFRETDEKRSRVEEQAGTEMTEDDVAWQLAQMEDMMNDQNQDQDQEMESQDEDEDSDEDMDVQARLQMLQTLGGSQSLASSTGRLEISPDNIQEREMLFLNMMRERGVTQFDTWDRAFSKIERDPRLYAIPDKKAREDLFESYCAIRVRELREAKEKKAKEIREEEESKDSSSKGKSGKESLSSSLSKSHERAKAESSSTSMSKPEAVYRKLMEDYTTKTSTWLDFMTKYRLDPRFLTLKPGSLRESIFRKYLSDLKKGILPTTKSLTSSSSTSDDKKRSSSSSHSSSSSSKKYKATKEEIDEFMSLLRETKKDILYEHKHSSSVEWKKIKRAIDRDRRYDAVGSSTEREMLFREYADKVIQRRD